MAQISVGIQLHENQIRVLFRHSSHGSGADGVFATEHQWFEAERKNRLRGLFHLGDHGFWGAERDLNGSEIREAEIVEIPIQLGAVGLKTTAHIPNRGGSEPGARSKRCGAVVGHAEQPNSAVLGSPLCPHVDRTIGVEQSAVKQSGVKQVGHQFSSRAMKAGMASKPPRCQRGLQMWHPSAIAAARLVLGWK